MQAQLWRGSILGAGGPAPVTWLMKPYLGCMIMHQTYLTAPEDPRKLWVWHLRTVCQIFTVESPLPVARRSPVESKFMDTMGAWWTALINTRFRAETDLQYIDQQQRMLRTLWLFIRCVPQGARFPKIHWPQQLLQKNHDRGLRLSIVTRKKSQCTGFRNFFVGCSGLKTRYKQKAGSSSQLPRTR